VGGGARWIDLLDPSRDELLAASPVDLHPRALDLLLAVDEHEPRPTLESHGAYVFGVLLVPALAPDEDHVVVQEIDLVLTPEVALSVRKTPPGGEPFDLEPVEAVSDARGAPSTGEIALHFVDAIAERYLDLVDALNDQSGEIEEGIESWPGEQTRRRLSALRRNVLSIRRLLTPTRDAVRRVVDGRVDVGENLVFHRSLELDFADAYDRLLRATESLDVSRELIADARDYHQAKIAQDQNEIVKKLAVVASLVLFPTFLVGVYGQNFEHMPELGWRFGYAFSWGLIALITIGQLAFFRWKKWI
jgi:magnesium transporter